MTDKTKTKSDPNGAGLTQDPPKQPEKPGTENTTTSGTGGRDSGSGAGLT